MSDINELISKSKQITSLLMEYKASKEYETCKYHLVKDDHTSREYYFLILIESGEMVADGPVQRIKSYINIRSIKHETIFGIQQIINL